MLFVPASRWPMIGKAAATAADAVCLDLEDSVPDADKAAGRSNAVRAFRELDFGRRLRMLRINALDGPFAYHDLIDVIEPAGDCMDLVMLPKTGSAADVAFVDILLGQIERSRGFARRIGIEAQIESAAGFVSIREISTASPRLEALIFGPGDYAASMRMPAANIGEADEHDALYPGHRWHAVMHAIVAHARAAGLRAIDGPYAAYKDPAGLERACRIARALGFDGKQAIHPSQLDAVNAAFAPTPEEVARARDMLAAYQRAVAEGRGAATFEGRMIDAANVRMAQTILEKQQ
jgi:citrate lyase beta subunit